MINKTLGMALAILLTVGASLCYAQPKRATDSHITGHAVDAVTHDHIAYANISIEGTTIGAVTDATGHFTLHNVPTGECTLSASMLGYEGTSEHIKVLPNKTIEVKFELRPAAVSMDEMVVTSNRSAVKRRESSSIVGVINAKRFEQTSANSLSEAMCYQTGLRVENNCSNCSVPQLRINGLEGAYTQVLLDSRPIFSSLSSVYSLEQLPSSMVERVEVVRGGGSALYGSNAIGGVVNIITKDPERNFISVGNRTGFNEKGNYDTNSSFNASVVSDDYRSGIYLFGMVKNKEQYDRDGDGYSESPNLESHTIGFRGYHRITRNMRLTAEYHNIGEFRRGGNLFDRQPHEADVAEQLNHSINGGGLKLEYWSPDRHHSASGWVSSQYINRKSYFGTHKNANAYGRTTDLTLVAGAQYEYRFDKLWFMPSTLTVGGEYIKNNLHDKMLGYNRDLRQGVESGGIYLQNEWRNAALSLLLGGRLDLHNKVSTPVFCPRVNVRYTPIREIAIRASYSSGFRAPQAYDEDLHVAAVGGEVAIITLAKGLRPEYSHSTSLSVDFNKRIDKFEVGLLVEGFFTKINDVFALVANGHDAAGNTILERCNESGATVAGVNTEFKLRYDKWVSLDAGYTYQRSRYDKDFKWSDAVTPQRRMLRSPDSYGYATLSSTPLPRLNISLTATYTGRMLVPHFAGYVDTDREKLTDAFCELGARIAYDIPLSSVGNMQVSFAVKNALDMFQPDLDRGINRDSKYIYGPNTPRTYIVGLAFSF